MESKKFDPKKLAKLNDPERLKYLNPDLIWETIGLKDPSVIVDIGAGTGFFSIIFAKKMKKGKVFACDISDTMLTWMREHLRSEAEKSVIPLKMDESSVPLPDAVADLVYMINLHHELEEPAKIISESYRLLKQGGKIAIIDWKKEETPEGPPLGIRVSEETIEHQMRDCCFPVVRSYPVLPYHHFLIGEKDKFLAS